MVTSLLRAEYDDDDDAPSAAEAIEGVITQFGWDEVDRFLRKALLTNSGPSTWRVIAQVYWGALLDGYTTDADSADATKRGQEMARLLADHAGYVWHDLSPGERPRADATLWTLSDERGAHDERSWGARLP